MNNEQLMALLERAKQRAKKKRTAEGILRTPEGISGARISMMKFDSRLWAAYTRGRKDEAAEISRFLSTRTAGPPPMAAHPAQSRPSTSPRSKTPAAAPRDPAAQQPALSQVNTLNTSNQSARTVRPAPEGALHPREPPAVPRAPSLPPYQYRPRTSPPAQPSNEPVPWPAPVAGTIRRITAGKPRKIIGKIRHVYGRPAECQRNKIQYVRPMAKAQRAGPSQERGVESPDQSGYSCANLQEPAEAVEEATLRTDQRPRDGQPVETADSADTRDSVPEDDIEELVNSEPALTMLNEILEDLPSFFNWSSPSSPRGD